jgi:hypothetical protein
MNIEILLERFNQWYGHTNFQEEQYLEQEYDYKLERGLEMREWLGAEALKVMTPKSWTM